MSHNGYRTRAMQASDPRYGRIFDLLDGNRPQPPEEKPAAKPAPPKAPTPAAEPPGKDELADLRAEYQSVLGKRPYMGWGADTLRDKIAAHSQAEPPEAAASAAEDTTTDTTDAAADADEE